MDGIVGREGMIENQRLKARREWTKVENVDREARLEKTVNQEIAFGEQGADGTENGRKELSNEM